MARLGVSVNGKFQEGERYLVALDGVCKPIQRALVVENGICRQYWPKTTDGTDKRIRWDTNQYDVKQSVQSPSVSQATITFDRATGMVTYNDYPNSDVVAEYLIPPLTGGLDDYGKYAIKVVQDSGDAIVGDPLGVWIDLNAHASLTWYLERTGVGENNASTTISIASDSGPDTPPNVLLDRDGNIILDRDGNPILESGSYTPIIDAATQVDKVVTFWSQVRGATGSINWTTNQWDIVEFKEVVDATCELNFNNLGIAFGIGDTSGTFQQEWHEDYPAVANPELYTVQVDLVSGTAPSELTGALGVPLTLDSIRQFILTATEGEDLTNELDVTVDTVPTSTPITKRVTMHSRRDAAAPSSVDPLWSNVWILGGNSFDPDDAIASIEINADGSATGSATNAADTEQDWNTETPLSDPENYEVRFFNTGGIDNLTFDNVDYFNNWQSLSSTRIVTFTLTNEPFIPLDSGFAEITVKIRRVGQPSVDKVIQIQLTAETPA